MENIKNLSNEIDNEADKEEIDDKNNKESNEESNEDSDNESYDSDEEEISSPKNFVTSMSTKSYHCLSHNLIITEILNEHIFDKNKLDKLYNKCDKQIYKGILFDLVLSIDSIVKKCETIKSNNKYLKKYGHEIHHKINNMYLVIEHILNNYDISEIINHKLSGGTILFYVNKFYYPDIIEKAVHLFISKGVNINEMNKNNKYCYTSIYEIETFKIFCKYPINFDVMHYEGIKGKFIKRNGRIIEEIDGDEYDIGKEFDILNHIQCIDEDMEVYKYEDNEAYDNYLTYEELNRTYTYREYIKFICDYIIEHNYVDKLYCKNNYDNSYHMKNFIEIYKIIGDIQSKSKSANKRG